jgi:hypothetical protein
VPHARAKPQGLPHDGGGGDRPAVLSLDDIVSAAREAHVALASGRSYELTAGVETDRVTIRARTGEIVLRIDVGDAGPVLSFTWASVEPRSTSIAPAPCASASRATTTSRVPGEASFRALETEWTRRMVADRAMRTQYSELVEVYTAHVRSLKK